MQSEHMQPTERKYCALCPSELTLLNRTKEHIFPNAIGGWKKVEFFICKPCNSRKGDDWDSHISAQFNWIIAMIGIKRDREEPTSELVTAVSGEKLKILPDGTVVPADLTYSKVETDGHVAISFVARTEREAKKKIRELHKKYNEGFDLDEALAKAKVVTRRLEEPLMIARTIGGPEAGRSVVCTALSFAFDNGISPHSCENVQQFLHDPTAPGACYGLTFCRDLVKNRPTDQTFLCVSLHGNKKRNQLVAYVEFYGYGRWLIVLSNHYKGPSFTKTLAVDPTTQEPLDLDIDWTISKNFIDRAVDGHGCNYAFAAAAQEHAHWLIRFLSTRRHSSKKTAQIMEEIRNEHGYTPDQELSHEEGMIVANEFVDKMMDHIDFSMLMGLNAKLRKLDD
jgi:hypothetical protein